MTDRHPYMWGVTLDNVVTNSSFSAGLGFVLFCFLLIQSHDANTYMILDIYTVPMHF